MMNSYQSFEDFLHRAAQRKAVVLLVLAGLVVVFCAGLGATPLADYDEATYAQVTRDTLNSGNVLSLQRLGEPWFEKPPLYFWLSMGISKVLGDTEISYRLVSALAAVALLCLVWILVTRKGEGYTAACGAVAVLAVTPCFFLYSREARLDIPVTLAIVAALGAWALGAIRPRYLIGVGVAVVAGIMVKSVVALFAVPIIIIFSLFFHEWRWMKSRWMWLGVVLGAALVIPWHWYQTVRYGAAFWQQYVGTHILDRAGTSISDATVNHWWSYFPDLARLAQPLTGLWLLSIVLYIVVLRRGVRSRLFEASSAAALLILVAFSLAATQILTYVLPAFPFMAMAIGELGATWWRHCTSRWCAKAVIGVGLVSLVIAIGAAIGIIPRAKPNVQPVYLQDEVTIAKAVYRNHTLPATVYLLGWPVHESIRYYSHTQVHEISFPPHGTKLTGPWFLVVPNAYLSYFLNSDGTVRDQYKNVELTETTGKLFLFYSNVDLLLE